MKPLRSPDVDQALQLFLRRLLGHSALADEEQAAIVSLPGVAVPAKPNVDVVHPGQKTDHSWLVATGLAGRFSEMIDGARQITALYLPGDMGDLHSLVRPRADGALQALTATIFVQVRHADLHRLMARRPRIAEAFWRDRELDSARLSRWLVNCSRRDASTRIAYLLCELATRLELAGLGGIDEFPLPMSQIQIGETLGLTAVHVNRVLQRLRRSDLIRFDHGLVRIPDWSRLAEIGQFDAENT